MLCKTCKRHRPETDFSKHSRCSSGYDSSRCKPCKRAKADWAKVPLERRIFNRAKARAKRTGRDFSIEIEDIYLPERCPVFGMPFKYGDVDWTYSIDRVDNDKGYVKGNIIIVSLKANRIKNSATVQELEEVVEFYKFL